MGEVDPVHVCMARGEYLVHRSWRMITWNHFFSAPFITPGLAGFGSRVEGLGWVYFYMHIAASGLLACIMLLCYIGSDCWPYNSFKWSEIWWVNSNRAHFKCSPGICLSAPSATLMLFSPILRWHRDGSFEYCHQLANSNISHSQVSAFLLQPWNKLAAVTAAWASGFWDFWTLIFWQWPSTVLNKLNPFWREDPAVSP